MCLETDVTQFDDQIRIAAETAGRAAEAEFESARRVLCTVNGEKYVPLERHISDLQDELDRLSAEKGNALRSLDAMARERDVTAVKNACLSTDVAHLREALKEAAQDHARAMDSLRASLTERIDEIDRLNRRRDRHLKDMAKLRRELDVARGAPAVEPAIPRRQSGDKVAKGGEQKSPQRIQLSVDARAVRDFLASEHGVNVGVSFEVSRIVIGMKHHGTPSITPHRVRKALAELEDMYVRKLTTMPKAAARYRRITPKRAVKRGGGPRPRRIR